MALATQEPRDDAAPVRDFNVERDRFVAFAFSAAEILFELDSDRRITFSTGATAALLGRSADAFIGLAFEELIAPTDRRLVGELLHSARSRDRLDDMVVLFVGAEKDPVRLVLTGYFLGEMGGRYFLSLRRGHRRITILEADLPRDAESGLLKQESYSAVVAERLKSVGENGESCKFTILDLSENQDLCQRMDQDVSREWLTALGACVRAGSLNGDSAGSMGEDRYGLVHEVGLDVGALRQRIETCAREFDPDGLGITVETASVKLEKAALRETDVAKALVHTINRFCQDQGDSFTVKNLSQSFENLFEQARDNVSKFREILEKESFKPAFQPIVELHGQQPQHFEALARFHGAPEGISPYELISFAEEVGLAPQFDIAMCRKVLEWLSAINGQGYKYVVAVNLSGRSIEVPAFAADLMDLIQEFDSVRDNLMFEITESAKVTDLAYVNDFVQRLRSAGHMVCLDDFGTGAAAFEYLRALQVDLIKIDGSYIKNAIANKSERILLKAMSGMLHELGIASVAEGIEDEVTLGFVKECGIRFGQGYLFGKPNTDIGAFDAPRPSLFVSKRPSAA